MIIRNKFNIYSLCVFFGLPFKYSLSKVIGNRWRSLSDEGKEFYRDVSARDAARQARQIEEQKQRKDSTKQDWEDIEGPAAASITNNITKTLKSHDLEEAMNACTYTVG